MAFILLLSKCPSLVKELIITPQTIVLCHFTGSFLVLNTILLIGKMFIFKTKISSSLCLGHFKNVIKSHLLLEKITAESKNKIG